MPKMAALGRRRLCLSIRNALLYGLREAPFNRKIFINFLPVKRSFDLNSVISRPNTTAVQQVTSAPFQRGRLAGRNESTETFLHLIDQEVRRTGRTSTRQVKTVYHQALKEGTMTSEHSVMLLRCLGSLLAEETPANRNRLVEEIWNKLPSLGVKYGTPHYNALLKVHLENDADFSPAEILADMEANGVVPNRVTYQRLISCFCHQGDLQSASQILEHMKQNQLSINEAVFSALIKCHMKLGEDDKAVNLLSVMRQAGMEPGNESYTALLLGYAEKGDIENMRKTLDDVSVNLGMLSPKEILDVIVTLATSGHKEFIDEVINQLNKTSGYNQDAINAVYQLVGLGHDDVAYKIFDIMPKPVTDQGNVTLGRFLIRAMVKHERPVEKVAELVNDLRAKNYNSDNIVGTTYLALEMGKIDYTLELFKMMQKEGVPTRSHFFWPLIKSALEAKNVESIYKSLSSMKEVCREQTDFMLTLHSYAIPALMELGQERDEVITRLQEIGFPENEVNFAVFLSQLVVNISDAVEFVKGKPVRFRPSVIRPNLEEAMRSAPDVENTLKILELAKNEWATSETSSQLNSDVVMSYARTFNGDQLLPLLQGMRERDLGVTRECVNNIDKVSHRADHEAIMQALHLLSVVEIVPSTQGRPQSVQLADKSTEELELLLKEGESRSERVQGIQKWLLSRYCAEGKVEAAEALMEDLSSKGFVFQADTLRQIVFMMATHKKDLEAALRYKNMLESQNPAYASYTWALFNVATLMVSEGKTEEAFKTIEDYALRHKQFMETKEFSSSYSNQDNCSRLLKAVAASGNVDSCQRMMELFFDQGYIKPSTHALLETFMTAALNSADGETIISGMQYLSEKHDRVVMFDEIFKFFIEKEDPDNLQKAMDLATKHHGEMNVLQSLMIGFLETNRVTQARKILQTPGLRAIMPRLVVACDRMIKENKIKELETLVTETKHLFAIDRDEMLLQLIKAYGNVGDHQKALGVLEMYEEEDIQPNGRTLRFLANVLKRLDQPVPFTVPSQSFVQAIPEETSLDVSGLNSEEQELFKGIVSGDLNKLLQLLDKAGDQKPSPSFVCSVGKFLFEKTRVNDFRRLCHSLADHGDVDSLQLLKNDLESSPYVLLNALFRAHVNSDRAGEFLEFLSSNPADVQMYVTGPNLELLMNKCPDLAPTMESLILRHTEETGKLRTINNLWTYYTLQDDNDKADQLLEKFPGLVTYLRVAPVCIQAKQKNQMDMLSRLLDTLRGHNPESLAFTYSYVIGWHCDRKDLDLAKSTLTQAQGDGVSVGDLQPKAVRDLTQLLEDNGEPLLWKPDDVKRKTQRKKSSTDESTSSDSSSSSESEANS